MKRTKGFTLVECLISLAVLAVASLVMAQIYAYVGNINSQNHYMNTSLSEQMSLVEQRKDVNTIKYKTTNKPVVFKRLAVNYTNGIDKPYEFGSYYGTTSGANNDTPGYYTAIDLKYDVEVKVLERLDHNGNKITQDYSKTNGNTERANYKYFEKITPP